MTDALQAATPAVMEAPAAGLAPARFRLTLERREDAGAVDALIAEAFGPGRFAKTAERLREGNQKRGDLCWCVWDGARLIGSVRTWPVAVGSAPGVFLGPIAVEAQSRRQGLGALLVERVCREAANAGDGFVLLVGDRGFFEPLGFEGVEFEGVEFEGPAAGRVRLPGPVDASRILWRALKPGALEDVEGAATLPALSRHARLKAAP